MGKKHKDLYKQIDEILWNDWDPIGVNDIDTVRNEYSGYVSHLVTLKLGRADVVKISKHLFHLETVDIGMSGNMERCRYIAQKIVEFK